MLTFADPRLELHFLTRTWNKRNKTASWLRCLTGVAWLAAACAVTLHMVHPTSKSWSRGTWRQHGVLGITQGFMGFQHLGLARQLANASREANALQDERQIALSAMYETTALMVIMVVGHGCAAAMITYSPLLAAFQAMYATACNVRLHTLLWLHALGFLCFFFVEVDRFMNSVLPRGPQVLTAGEATSPWELARAVGRETLLFLAYCAVSSALLAVRELWARKRYLEEEGHGGQELGPFWTKLQNILLTFRQSTPSGTLGSTESSSVEPARPYPKPHSQ